jgi:hypothetical protein
MNKFELIKCIEVKEGEYDGPCVILSCATDPSFCLFFPMSEENAKTVNLILNDDATVNLGIYKTMLDSWDLSGRYLSGIIMDTVFDDDVEDDILMARLALADHNGVLDSIVPVNFVHAILLAAMTDSFIILTDNLLDAMMPGTNEDDDEEEEDPANQMKNTPRFPEDKKIIDIAKNIMSGKIKNDKKDKNEKDEKNKNSKS